MKQIRTVRHSFNTKGTANYRVQLVVPPSTNNNHNHNNSVNEAHRIIVKQAVYDEFMKQIRTVRHSFNTKGTANYRVQLAVPPFN